MFPMKNECFKTRIPQNNSGRHNQELEARFQLLHVAQATYIDRDQSQNRHFRTKLPNVTASASLLQPIQ